MIERTLLWTPKSKDRAHTAFKNGKVRTYTPRATVEAEHAIAAQWVGAPLEGPITVYLILHDDHIDVTVDVRTPPTNRKLLRGDIDNYAKLIMDALNGVAWVDDKQIATLMVTKI